MCEPRRLTTLWASTACYRYSFATFFTAYIRRRNRSLLFENINIVYCRKFGGFFWLSELNDLWITMGLARRMQSEELNPII
jgi:hypothetical protein